MPPVRTVVLPDPVDLAAFRQRARGLLAEGVSPDQVLWREGEGGGDAGPDLFAGEDHAADPANAAVPAGPATTNVPASFLDLCGQLILHRDPGRLALMYRLLWRLSHDALLRHDPLDADRLQARRMAASVRRDIHKMRAFVRFTPLTDEDGRTRHVAWFEPEHRIVIANAPFFARRFAQMHWAILTPQACVEWDGRRLSVEPGAGRSRKPAPDAGEALWLTYYASIFNPARLKLAAMRREMPVRYWHNLPEAALIQPLTASATARSEAMVDAEPTAPRRMRLLPTGHGADAPEGALADLSVVADLPDLPALRAAAQSCRACPIGAGATQAVCGEGQAQAPAHMLVGEQPGDREDLAGRPFVGPAGQLLDRALAQLDWPRAQLYLTNAVKHFKYELRGKRRLHKTPGQREALACAHWLTREIELVRPGALVALGATAAGVLLGRPVAVQRERGRWLHERADGRPVLVTLHPSALLRMDDALRAEAYVQWLQDLAVAQAGIDAGIGG